MTVRGTSNGFSKYFDQDDIAREMAGLSASLQFRGWERVRNVLSHRQSPGRAISMGETSVGWLQGTLDAGRITADEAWLRDTLGALVEAADEFASARF